MMGATRRRVLLKALVLNGIAASLPLTLSRSVLAQAAAFSWANLTPGFTILVTDYLLAKGLDKKHGFTLAKPTSYTSVTTYYNDFVAGNYDVCIGSWDTFSARYQAGVPIQFVCAITTADMINIVVPGHGAKDIKALEGKTLAAPQSTGTYRMMRAVIKEIDGFDIEKQMTVQNVDNPAASMTLVMSDRTDAALSWDPNISAALSRVPDLRVVYNAGDEYRKKFNLDLPYFGLAVRKDLAARNPGLAGRLDQAMGECLAGITGNVDEAMAIGAKNTGIAPEVLKLAITSGRLRFKHLSMADPQGRNAIKTANDMLVKNGMLPHALDDGFFAV